MPAHPFMGPALLEGKKKVLASIAADLKIEMEKSARRIAARAAKKNRRAFWELLRKYRLDARDLHGEQRAEPASTQVRAN